MMHTAETRAIAAGGTPAARATARLLAIEARSLLAKAQSILDLAGDKHGAALAATAGEATTDVLRHSYDGPEQVFACPR